MYRIHVVSKTEPLDSGQLHGMCQTGGCHTGFLILVHHAKTQAICHHLTQSQQFFLWCQTHTIGLYSIIVTEILLHLWEPHARSLPIFLPMLPMALARSSSSVIAIHYVLLVLQMTLCFSIVGHIAV